MQVVWPRRKVSIHVECPGHDCAGLIDRFAGPLLSLLAAKRTGLVSQTNTSFEALPVKAHIAWVNLAIETLAVER